MKHYYSLKNILMSIFFVSFIIPLAVMILIVPASYKKQYNDEIEQLIDNNLDLFSENINSYLFELQTLTAYPVYKEDVIELLQNRIDNPNSFSEQAQLEIEELFNTIIPDYLRISRQDLLSLVVYYSGTTLYSNRNSNVDLIKSYDFKDQSWYQETIQGGDKINYIGSHKPEYFTYSDTMSVFSVARVIKHPYKGNITGVVIADADTAVFEQMLKAFSSSVSSVTILLDEKNEILFSSREIDQFVLGKLKQNEKSVKIGKDHYYANYSQLSPSKWKIAVLLSNSEIVENIRSIYIRVILISFLGLMISYLFYNFFVKRFISNPINHIMSVMKQVENGNLEVQYLPKSISEINSVGMSLNDMIEELNNHINKEYKLVLQQKNAEYRALQSQIQPHFIYNVLNGFFALNRLGRREVLEKSIMDLTGMMRYTMSVDEITTIQDELSFIEKYFSLQQLRFEERLSYKITVSDKVKDLCIPRILIQPLVENAIKHGLEPLVRECLIEIIVDQHYINDRLMLRILVRDNGAGFDTGHVLKEGIGLSNIRERIQNISSDSKLTVSSIPDKGTMAVILIPGERV